MQTSNEDIIFQLTNIGAAQRGAPLRTPKKSSSSKDDPLTPSPSSRGKRWTDRLASFPGSSERRKKSLGSQSSLTSSPGGTRSVTISSPISSRRSRPAAEFSEPQEQYPSRTSSLPRPTSNLHTYSNRDLGTQGATIDDPASTESLRRLPPPRVLPFGYAETRASPKKSFIKEVCTVCDEPIFTRSNGERIIELECGHISHQECLLISLEASKESSSDEFFAIFPRCDKCRSDCFKDARCLPKNHDLKDALISEFLINRKLGSPNLRLDKQVNPHHPVQSILSSPAAVTRSHQQTLLSPAVRPTRSAFQVPLVNTFLSPQKTTMSAIRPQKMFSLSSPQVRQVTKGSSWAASSSIVSSATHDQDSIISNNYSLAESSVKLSSVKTQIPILRAYFIEILLSNFKNEIFDWQLDNSYGLLRLVDELVVSLKGSKYKACWCYLFEKALIVAPVSTGAKKDPKTLSSVTLESLLVYAPISEIKVETVEASVLKCSILTNDKDSWQELFITETLNTDTSKIIQKWISGLLNHDLTFDDRNFTSTLQLPPIMKNSATDTGSLIGFVASNKVIELSGLEQASDSVIVRRGFQISPTKSKITSTIEGMESAMTSISSILSLKREKPDELVVVLQWDSETVVQHATSIYNSIKALIIKYPDFKVCVVDSSGFTVTHGIAKNIFTDPTSICDLKQGKTGNKFDPKWLSESFYPNGVVNNLGIAVISSASMEAGKSCLLMDFKPFTCEGRRRPNELKLRIGYLNADYTHKVDELVEVASWSNFLEALSYSFCLTFGDDEDDEDSDVGYSSDEDLDISDLKSVSDVKSTTTLLIGSSLDDDSRTMRERVVPSALSGTVKGVCQAGKGFARDWDPLINDIDSAIRELRRSASPDTNYYQSASCNYL